MTRAEEVLAKLKAKQGKESPEELELLQAMKRDRDLGGMNNVMVEEEDAPAKSPASRNRFMPNTK